MSQQASDKCWQNGSIFQSIKLILEVSLSPHSGPPVIDLSYAQENFATILGYPLSCLPMPLESLFSAANTEFDVTGLVQAIHRCTSHDAFIILRDAQGVDLACHVHLSLGNKFDNRFSKSSADTNGLQRDHVSVLTIRSASTIGNARAINMLVNPVDIDSSHPDYNVKAHGRLLGSVTRQIDANTETAKAAPAAKSKNGAGKDSASTTRAKAAPSAPASVSASAPFASSSLNPAPMPALAALPAQSGGSDESSAAERREWSGVRTNSASAQSIGGDGNDVNAPASSHIQNIADLPVLSEDIAEAEMSGGDAVSPSATTPSNLSLPK